MATKWSLTCLGEGSTSQGEFWEAMNTASNQKLPVIFCVEDNGYAISVPVEVNTPGGNISKLVANFPNFFFAEIDGTDAEVCLRTFQAAAEHCRAGKGPAFVHGHCVRAYSHSLSDDDKLYRSAAEREADALRDPIAKMQMRLMREGILTEAEINELEQSQSNWPRRRPSARCRHRCPRWRALPRMSIRKTWTRRAPRSTTNMRSAGRSRRRQGKSAKGGDPHTMADLINACLHDEMRARPAHCDVWRRRGRRQPRTGVERGQGQGRRLQADGRTADGVRLGAGVQLAAGRSQHCGPGRGLCDSGHEAGGGDSVLRLHLAGHAPDSQ